MTSANSVPPVWKSAEVACGREDAFAFLTGRPTVWWPENHRLGHGREAVVFEPCIGGRWYERYSDGSERDWGRVLEWVPGHRLTLSWLIDGRFAPIDDDRLASRIRIVLSDLGPGRSLASIGHVDLHRHGDDAPGIRSHLEGPSPGDTLAGFVRAVDLGATDDTDTSDLSGRNPT
jgi:uncharacterized protein YndB with AHSA1/START domain